MANFTQRTRGAQTVGALTTILCLFLTRISHAASDIFWQSAVAQTNLAVKLIEPADISSNKPIPLIIYLEHLAAPRVGTESDEALLQDFQNAGYLVATVDFAGNERARVPFINRDLGKLRDDIRYKKFLANYNVDGAHIFIVPAGCRLMRDVVFYPDPKRTLALDIVYPSKPSHPVGAVIEFSCDNVSRMGNTSLSICSDTILDAEATEGLAVAMADHPVPPPYKGLDAMPDCAWKIKAAVRTLRAEGAKLGFNGNIASVGFSRGSGMALMLVTTEGMPKFEDHGANTNVSSAVQGAVVMSGRFSYLNLLPDDHMIPRYEKVWGKYRTHSQLWREEGAVDYLQHATMPLFLTINCTEDEDAQHQMATLRKHLADLGNDEIFMMDREPRGHKVTLVPEILDAMNHYLKERLYETRTQN